VPQKKKLSWLKHILRWATVVLSVAIISNASYASLNLEGIQVYQKSASSPGKKVRLVDDVRRYHSAENLWDVLRYEFSLPHHEYHTAVQENIDWLMNDQDFLIRTATRSAPYLYFIHQQVKNRKLPVELVLLPIIESGYNPFIYSTAGAAGIWQMMPDTASGFGIKQDWWYDGRRDVVASTRAALDYLSYLFDFFDGNSLLAIAAYNSGEGAVMSAIRRNIREGKSTDFWSLPLPRETRTYVPRLLALATIIAHPERYPLRLPAVRNAPYLAQVDVGGQIDLKRAATFAGLSLKKFQQLNPGYNRLVTHPNGPYKLVLPIENVERFMVHLANTSLSHHIDWTQYKIKSGDTLESLAKRFNTTSYALKEINHLTKKAAIKKGMKLVIPRTVTTVLNTPPKYGKKELELTREVSTPEETTPLLAANLPANTRNETGNSSHKVSTTEGKNYANDENMKAGDTLYMVRNNDTVEKIAEHFKLPPKIVYTANNLHSYSLIHPGDQLLIPTHLAQKETSRPIETQEMRKLSPGDTLYMIRQGDTIEKIAQKFKTTPAAIRIANLMADGRLQEGDHLIVPTHLIRGRNQGTSLPLKIPT
jgi:membrane-bound lytic murein transglycosylase D